MKPRISLIVAMAKNRVIGINNTLPWHLPADLKHFKALTMGHHIVMGRKTYESIGKPLPGRTSVVVTRNAHYAPPGVVVVNSLEAAIAACGNDEEIFVIGGAELYSQAIDLADRIY
ncbi:MAG: dihydrofolate reductase, partial [Gallionella sp.]